MTKTISSPSSTSAASMARGSSEQQLGDVRAIEPIVMSRENMASEITNFFRARADGDQPLHDRPLKISQEGQDEIAAWWAKNNDINMTQGSAPLTFISALGVARAGDITMDELLAGIKSPKTSVIPATSDISPVTTSMPTPADMLALQEILANIEPASGNNGGGVASRAGGAGFGSAVDPAVLLGLDRLGGVSATFLSGLDDAANRNGRGGGIGDDLLTLRSVSLVDANNNAVSADDSMMFDGSPALFGEGNVLLNDTSTSKLLILKTVTFNGVVYDVPVDGRAEIVGSVGRLSIASNGDYTYTPIDAKVLGVDISGVDLFEYTAEDSAKIITTATLAVTVRDNIPVAVDDVIATDHMNLTRVGTLLSGDKLGNGAMRLATVNGQVVGPDGITIDRADLGYRIVIAADGSYTMTAANLRTGIDTLTYSTIDGDGDASGIGRAAISFADTAPVLTSKVISSTNMNLVTTGTLISESDAVGDGSVRVASIAGQSMPAGGSLVLDTADYILTVQSNGDYRLEGKNGRTAVNVQLPFMTADSDGDISDTSVITLSVRDRVPEVMEESTTVRGGLNVTTQAITGTVNGVMVPDTAGDGTHRYELLSGTQGRFGTVTLGADGYYRYDLNSTKDVLTNTVDLYERISYRVTDEDGDTSTSDFFIIIDTDGSWQLANLMPNGVDETVTLEGALVVATQQIAGTISGNVLSNGDALGNNPATVTLLDPAGQGSYGSIVMNANGSYVYTLDGRATKTSLQGPLVNETFIYEITDADGDMSTAAITIKIRPDGSWSQDNFVPVASGEIIAVDGSLSLVTQRVTGSIFGTVLDGQDNLGDGLGRVELVGSSVGSHGRLTLNADGTFRYDLDDAKSNLQGMPTDTFTYRIIDRDGDVSNTVTLTVRIGADGSWSQDDQTPVAVSETIIAEGVLNSVTQRVIGTKEGSVLGNGDTLGDGLLRVELMGSKDGAHGQLILNDDGSFRYVLNDTKLNLQGSPSDSFSYRIIDRDGSISNVATLKINITSDGTWSTSNALVSAVADIESVTGTLSGDRVVGTLSDRDVSLNDNKGDGPVTVVIEGSSSGKFGSIEMGGDGRYIYRLNADKNDMRGDLTERFTYRITDKDGDTSTATLTITITSDGTWISDNITPVASDGNGGLSSGEVSIVGNIISSLVTSGNGAKTITSISINGGTAIAVAATETVHTGTYGTITIRADGAYSYVGKDDATGTDVITYTVRDQDGDTDSGTLTLLASDRSPRAIDDHVQTTNMVMTSSGNIIQANDQLGDGALRIKSVLGFDVPPGGSYTFDNLEYRLTVFSDGRYEFAAKNGQNNDLPAYPYVIIDQDGDESSGQIHLKYSDLLPVAINDLDSFQASLTDVANQRVTATVNANINAAGITLGDNGSFSLISNPRGQFGSIEIRPDGSYQYRLDASKNDLISAYRSTGSLPQEVFTYRITDEDGDMSESRLVIKISPDSSGSWSLDNSQPDISNVENMTVATELLPVTGIIPIVAGDGLTRLRVNGTEISATGTTIIGTHGTLTIKADGTYSYLANNNAGGSDRFNLEIKDQDGDTDTAVLTLTGRDLKPIAGDVTASGSGNGSTDLTITGNLLERSSSGDGILRVASVFGRDVPAGGMLTLTGTDLNMPSSIISLTVSSNGSYTLVAPKGASMNGSFSFGVADEDGDVVLSPSLNLIINNADSTASTPTLSVDPLIISEDGAARLVIRATNNDTDSERLTITATIPSGWTVVDLAGGTLVSGVWTHTLGVGDSLAGWGPIVQPPLNWNGTMVIPVSAISTESNGGGVSTAISVQASVTVNSVNDVPVISGDSSGTMDENANIGTPILQLSGSDADGNARWSLTGPGSENFEILSDGTIRNRVVLDADSGTTVYNFTAILSDGQSSASRPVEIRVNNINDSAPVVNNASVDLLENQNPGVIFTATATDADQGDTRTWSIVSGNDQGAFTINAQTGEVATTRSFNKEGEDNPSLIIRVTDAGGNTADLRLGVNLINQNETGSISGSHINSIFSVAENEPLTTYVGQMSLVGDPEGDVPTWSIIAGTGADRFTIDPNSGIIRTAYQFNYEDQNELKTYTLTVQADDGRGGRVTKDITVNIANKDEPVSITGGLSGSVNENDTSTVITTVVATDPDGDPITWSLSGNDAGRFIIDANGNIRASGSGLDYETRPLGGYQVRVTASTTTSQETRELVIGVNDVPENNIPVAVTDTAVSGNLMSNDTIQDGPGSIAQITFMAMRHALISGIEQQNELPWYQEDRYFIGPVTIDMPQDGITHSLFELTEERFNNGYAGAGYMETDQWLEIAIMKDNVWTGRTAELLINSNGTYQIVGPNLGQGENILINYSVADSNGDVSIGDLHYSNASQQITPQVNSDLIDIPMTYSVLDAEDSDPYITGGGYVNVLGNDTSSNVLTVKNIGTFNGNYGNLTIQSNGDAWYTFEMRGRNNAYDYFEYTVTDSFGNESMSYIEVAISFNLVSPLILDINRDDQINLISIDAGVMFDMSNDGILDHTGWVGTDDGLLALDLNANGLIDNQHELFGSPRGSPLEINGFTDLASHDENLDGKVNAMDSVWSKLVVWQDLNGDGVSQNDEMKSVMEYEIESISTAATRINENVAGNMIYWDGDITMNDGSSMNIVDAYFQVVDGVAETIPNAMIERASSIDDAIAATLTEQLSASETTDLDAAIHEFLVETQSTNAKTLDGQFGIGPLPRDVVVTGVLPMPEQDDRV